MAIRFPNIGRADHVRYLAHETFGQSSGQLARHEVQPATQPIPCLQARSALVTEGSQIGYQLLCPLCGVPDLEDLPVTGPQVELHSQGAEDLVECLGLLSVPIEVKPQQIQQEAGTSLGALRQLLSGQDFLAWRVRLLLTAPLPSTRSSIRGGWVGSKICEHLHTRGSNRFETRTPHLYCTCSLATHTRTKHPVRTIVPRLKFHETQSAQIFKSFYGNARDSLLRICIQHD